VLAYVPALMASSVGWCSSNRHGAQESLGDDILYGGSLLGDELVTATRLRRVMQLKAAVSGLLV
jgi:hypothetical protein